LSNDYDYKMYNHTFADRGNNYVNGNSSNRNINEMLVNKDYDHTDALGHNSGSGSKDKELFTQIYVPAFPSKTYNDEFAASKLTAS